VVIRPVQEDTVSDSTSRRRLRRRATIGAAAGVAAVAVGVTQALLSVPVALAGSLPAATQFYVDPNSQAVRWVAANPNDSRASAINSRIAQVPSGIWFSNYSPSTVTADVSKVTGAAAAAGRTPVLVVYEIPNRDCGGASAGGAPDLASYQAYIDRFAAGLGTGSAIIILEPDSIALQTCLSGQQVTDRDNALATAVGSLKSANANAKVYLDAGHSAWNSAADQASRLNAAGVKSSDGIYSNVSNFNATGNEVSFDKAVLSALGSPANLHAVVDTSRNGNGPGSTWCDPSGRALGRTPTASTGDTAVDAYLWVKPPGEADGCADPAGVFDPALAYALITNGPSQPPTTAPPTTAPPSTAPPTTAPPSTAPPTTPPAGAACKVTYSRQSEWAGGFVANVTVANTGSGTINGWTLTFTFGGDQHVTSTWNATLTQSGAGVSVNNASFNGTISTGQSVSFGFQGTWSGSDASPTTFSVNGAACS
jgi:endoglucanase